jgi:hypothetical protein
VVKKGERVTDNEDSCKLQVCDLDNIQNAWELYKKKNKLQLPTMVQYREQFMAANSNKGFVTLRDTQSRQDDFKRWKKEWMLRVRRDAKISKSVREARGRSSANSQEDYDSQSEESIDDEDPDVDDPLNGGSPGRDSIIPETQLVQGDPERVQTSAKPTQQKATSSAPISTTKADADARRGRYNSSRAEMSLKMNWSLRSLFS